MIKKYIQFINESVDNIKSKLSQLSDDAKKEGVVLSISLSGDKIILHHIESNEKGKGSLVMQNLIDFADNEKLKIGLIASPNYGSDIDRLIGFYKKFGFESIEDNLYKYPESQKMERNPNEYIKEGKTLPDIPKTWEEWDFYEPESTRNKVVTDRVIRKYNQIFQNLINDLQIYCDVFSWKGEQKDKEHLRGLSISKGIVENIIKFYWLSDEDLERMEEEEEYIDQEIYEFGDLELFRIIIHNWASKMKEIIYDDNINGIGHWDSEPRIKADEVATEILEYFMNKYDDIGNPFDKPSKLIDKYGVY